MDDTKPTRREVLREQYILGPDEAVEYCGNRITKATLANRRTTRAPGSPEWITLGDKIGYTIPALDRWMEANTHRPPPVEARHLSTGAG